MTSELRMPEDKAHQTSRLSCVPERYWRDDRFAHVSPAVSEIVVTVAGVVTLALKSATTIMSFASVVDNVTVGAVEVVAVLLAEPSIERAIGYAIPRMFKVSAMRLVTGLTKGSASAVSQAYPVSKGYSDGDQAQKNGLL
jgi:hypothetical protein